MIRLFSSCFLSMAPLSISPMLRFPLAPDFVNDLVCMLRLMLITFGKILIVVCFCYINKSCKFRFFGLNGGEKVGVGETCLDTDLLVSGKLKAVKFKFLLWVLTDDQPIPMSYFDPGFDDTPSYTSSFINELFSKRLFALLDCETLELVS